ncbi:hypothetical protein [Luteolibacter soli]|uniref:SnoaL-like domain-containing protein n=1 Tax=Luteolibacter soli TaxID=3135280 RepID=A0ABU9AXQ0_9BACT
MRRLLVPLLLLLVLAGGFGWWWYQPERVIGRRIVAFFEAADVEETASDISRTTRGGSLAKFFAPNVTINGPEDTREYADGPQSRDSLVSNYTIAAKNCRRISFETPEIDEVTVSGDTAQAKARVDAIVEVSSTERPADGILHLDMEWKKIEGDWVLSSVSWEEKSR